jgi:hypothetical protein
MLTIQEIKNAKAADKQRKLFDGYSGDCDHSFRV